MFTSKFLKPLILLFSFFPLAHCMEEKGEPQWLDEFNFQLTCGHGEGETEEIFPNVLFTCQDKCPVRYILPNPPGFPQLNLHNPQSCERYFQEVSQYVARLKLLRREYVYCAQLNGQNFALIKMPPNQLPLPCILSGLCLIPNYNLRKLELSWGNLRLGGEESGVILDVTDKIKHRMGEIPLPPSHTEGESYLEQIVSTKYDFNDRVYDALGAINIYKIPAVPGVSGCEMPQQERFVLYTNAPTLYEDAIASFIFSRQAKKKLIILEPGDEGALLGSATASSSLSSYESAMEEEELDHNFDLYRHFKLVGDERRARSPYIYNNGRTIFLTQTFEQDCHPFIKGEMKEGETFTLRYTRETSYPVQAAGFSPPERVRGIYQAEGDSWLLLNGFYEAQETFPAQPLSRRGPLTEMICSQTETYDLKTTLDLIGPLGEYVELIGQEKFAQLVEQFRDCTRGILKAIGDLPEAEDHLVVPFLLSIRHREDLEEPELMDDTAYDKYENHNKCAWNFYHAKGKTDFSKLPLREKLKDLDGCLHIHTLPSLKLLPLLTLTHPLTHRRHPELTLSKKPRVFPLTQGPDCLANLILSHEDYKVNHPVSLGPSGKIYAYIAQYLNLDKLRVFGYGFPYDLEEDGELTIQPLAHCLRSLRNLHVIPHLPNWISIKNYEYLIDHGLCQNRSITSLIISVRGDYPIALLGRLLAKNTTLKQLTIYAPSPVGVSDYECFNELGRGLMKNKTLEKLTLGICPILPDRVYSDWQEASGAIFYDHRYLDKQMVRRPLPGRPQGSTTCDFSVLERALLESNINYIYAPLSNPSPPNTSQEALRSMLKGLEKPGLQKNIR